MVVEAGEARAEDFLEAILVKESTHEPEGSNFTCVIQQYSSYEIHTLHVPN